MKPRFDVHYQDQETAARLGSLTLAHGVVTTPVFMPVGTHGTVRGLPAPRLRETGAEIMLSNTYHLCLRPGTELIRDMKGLHAFQSWDRPILTDSGGFQVFSLSEFRKISDEGVVFKNPYNGEHVLFTPESVVAAQETFGSDVMMVLDECPPAHATPYEISEALRRTKLWARRSKAAKTREDLALFGIIQGGCHLDLRRQSLQDLLEVERETSAWDGLAIGGLSVGEEKHAFVDTMLGMVGWLPENRPHYLMGMGGPRDLVFAVACGVDMFDCVIPSRNGRHGLVMTFEGKLNLINSHFKRDERPIEEGCPCETCRTYSRSFLRHLFVAEDALAGQLCTLHNVTYFVRLMDKVRKAIRAGQYRAFVEDFVRNPRNSFLKREDDYPALFDRGVSFENASLHSRNVLFNVGA